MLAQQTTLSVQITRVLIPRTIQELAMRQKPDHGEHFLGVQCHCEISPSDLDIDSKAPVCCNHEPFAEPLHMVRNSHTGQSCMFRTRPVQPLRPT